MTWCWIALGVFVLPCQHLQLPVLQPNTFRAAFANITASQSRGAGIVIKRNHAFAQRKRRWNGIFSTAKEVNGSRIAVLAPNADDAAREAAVSRWREGGGDGTYSAAVTALAAGTLLLAP